MSTNSSQETLKFSCELCNIQTNNKKDYNNHLLTRKHTNNVNPQQFATPCSSMSKCKNCGKEYESRSGLWRHEKNCDIKLDMKNNSESDIKILTNLVLELVKSNADLKKQMLEICKINNSVTA